MNNLNPIKPGSGLDKPSLDKNPGQGPSFKDTLNNNLKQFDAIFFYYNSFRACIIILFQNGYGCCYHNVFIGLFYF